MRACPRCCVRSPETLRALTGAAMSLAPRALVHATTLARWRRARVPAAACTRRSSHALSPVPPRSSAPPRALTGDRACAHRSSHIHSSGPSRSPAAATAWACSLRLASRALAQAAALAGRRKLLPAPPHMYSPASRQFRNERDERVSEAGRMGKEKRLIGVCIT
jgi:hypothetical protein